MKFLNNLGIDFDMDRKNYETKGNGIYLILLFNI